MQGTISIRFERCISFTKTIEEFKKIMWNITILWQSIIFISKNAYGIKYFTFNLTIIYKHYMRLFTE